MLNEKLFALRKKYGFSQQELADLLQVSRQTISNWECGQGAPALDKAAELAEIYHISLDDLTDEKVEIEVNDHPSQHLHILKQMIGKTVMIDCSDLDFVLDTSGTVKIIDVNDTWLRIEYERAKKNPFKKETVIKLLDMQSIDGIKIVEETK